MSTQFYNTPWDHSSDATFRAWGLAFSTALQAAGTASGKLTVTTDTGQINWATVTRPGVSTAAGYEIYKFADTLAGAAPIYLKIEYGTGGSATIPQMWITVGTGSNGSGTLTGSTSTRNIWTRTTAIVSTVTNYPTYISSNEGSLTIGFKLGAGSSNLGFGFLGIGRPCNLDASLRSDAVIVLIDNGTQAGCEVVRFSDGTKFGSVSNGGFGMVTLAITASTVAGSFQSWQTVCAYPQTYGINWAGIVLSSEIVLNTSITATYYGSSSHTYVSLGLPIGAFSVTAAAGHSPAMLYE